METLKDRIDTLIAIGYEQEFEKLATRLEKKPELHPDLKKKLDEIKDTPIDEPELFKIIDSDVELATTLLTNKQIDDFSVTEVGDFLFAVKTKINSYKREDGVYKSTPNTENLRLPNFVEADKLMQLAKEQNDKVRALGTAKDKEKAKKDYEATNEKLANLIFKITNLNKDDLTDWETGLVTEQLFVAATNGRKSAMGKRF